MSVTNGTREREGTIEGGWVRSSEREGTSDGETDGGPKKGGLVLVTVGIVGKADLLWQNAVAQRSVGA